MTRIKLKMRALHSHGKILKRMRKPHDELNIKQKQWEIKKEKKNIFRNENERVLKIKLPDTVISNVYIKWDTVKIDQSDV